MSGLIQIAMRKCRIGERVRQLQQGVVEPSGIIESHISYTDFIGLPVRQGYDHTGSHPLR